ncbi:MAG: branched-chain amino acid ABC transporter permease [Bacillota bacterium]
MTFAMFVQYFASGIARGSVYAIIALGFTLVYNTCDIINFAQGEFVMLGAMIVAVVFYKILHFPLFLAALLAVVCVALIGYLAARLTIYPLREASPLNMIIATIGLSILIRGTAMSIWSKDPQNLPAFSEQGPVNQICRNILDKTGIYIDPQNIWILIFALIVMSAMILFFKFTITGRAMRACAQNRIGAQICGIKPSWMMIYAYVLSATLGAATGIVIAPQTTAQYDMGVMLGLKGFCGAIIGGLFSFPGAIIGGLLLGMSESLGAALCQSEFKDAITFFILLLVLYLKPAGIFGRKQHAT